MNVTVTYKYRNKNYYDQYLIQTPISSGDSSFSVIPPHNELSTIQGGVALERYHMTAAQYAALNGRLSNIVEDTTPQLGGFLDTNGKSIHESVGTTFAAANNIAPTRTGNTFVVSGATQINLIDIAALWTTGNIIKLQFSGTPIIKHNYTVSGTNKPIYLKREADYTAVVGNILVLEYDGTVWREIGDLTTRIYWEKELSCSDLTTPLTVATSVAYFRTSHAITLTAVYAWLLTAGTGGTLVTVDINENGTSILSTKLTFDSGEKTTATAATQAVISDTALAAGSEITIDRDAVGNTIAGAGLIVKLEGYRT